MLKENMLLLKDSIESSKIKFINTCIYENKMYILINSMI